MEDFNTLIFLLLSKKPPCEHFVLKYKNFKYNLEIAPAFADCKANPAA